MDRRGVHERMAAAPSALGEVGPGTNQRVRDRVEGQRDEQRSPGKRAGQTEHLVVVEQQKEAESGGFDAFRQLRL